MNDKDKTPSNEQNFEQDKSQNNENYKDLRATDDSIEEFSDDRPAVSNTKKRNIVMLAGGALIATYLIYSLLSSFSNKTNVPKTENQKMKQEARKSSTVPENDSSEKDAKSISASSALPGAQESSQSIPVQNKIDIAKQSALQDTLPPPPALPPVFDPASIYIKNESNNYGAPSPPSLNSSGTAVFGEKYTRPRNKLPDISEGSLDNADNSGIPENVDPETLKKIQAQKQSRINASMFVGGSRSAPKRVSGIGNEDNNNGGFDLKESGASSTDVTIRRDLDSVILQGKVIDAVLETAINTDLPGKLRGILSRDVYSEDGKRIVIPKGSRLIGSYATDVKFNQARVYVIWSRVIRPDGVDAVLGGDDLTAIDALGRTGVYGDLDNRYFDIFGSSILVSAITVGFALAADAAAGNSNSTTTTTPAGSFASGTTTTTGSIASQGISQAVTQLGSDTASIAKNLFKTTPRITVDQGTKIKIFVNKDIIFPPSYFSSGVSKYGVQFIN